MSRFFSAKKQPQGTSRQSSAASCQGDTKTAKALLQAEKAASTKFQVEEVRAAAQKRCSHMSNN